MSPPLAPARAGNAESEVVNVQDLAFAYGDRQALRGISFRVAAGEVFGLLGPNGGGKTTLFRILSTLFTYSRGRVEIFGSDLATKKSQVRERIGVVFQKPSLDSKLTVIENLRHQGHLYGLRGADLRQRTAAALDRLGIRDRERDLVETLSGGLMRRVELAKGLLTRPSLLILDEPSTGLDPGARRDLWNYLERLRSSEGTTILVTTHLMAEAEICDRLAILDRGRIVSMGSPDSLRSRIGGNVITIRSGKPDELARRITERFGQTTTRLGDTLRMEKADGHNLVRQLVEAFPDRIDGINLGKPTLEDVFIHETGHRFWSEEP